MINNTTYRIRTNVGDDSPINIPISLMQEYNSFEILSLKVNTDDAYRSYTSPTGIIVGRVSTANNGLGIPNVRVSVFVPNGTYEQSDEEKVLYPFSSPTDLDGDRVRYNLLPSSSDVLCYQVVGTFPTKRKILDNETICEVFDKFYKYTTVTNEAGDFMLANIPVGKHRIHIDADLSDIGPFLSQKPYDMMENLGYDKNKFESSRQFKSSNDLDSLVQIISQNKSVYVYPYWGDATENGAELKITRTDLTLNYEFKTSAVFMGSVVTDRGGNAISDTCVATMDNGRMSELITGSGRIEMIRKTVDGKIEQVRVNGDELINENGVWCYSVPMNLDYVRTDEFGNIIPTDDPSRGVPTRARVRFRITLKEIESDDTSKKRCSYLVPNNPNQEGEAFLKTNSPDYSFGSATADESFVDLFMNNVYTVKSYIPRLQKSFGYANRRHTGIKMVNHSGGNNPFPYNSLTLRLSIIYRVICVIMDMFMGLIWFLNVMISVMGSVFGGIAKIFDVLYSIKILWVRPFFFLKPLVDFFWSLVFECVGISENFCVVEGQAPHKTYPGCTLFSLEKTRKSCQESSKKAIEPYECDFNDDWLNDCYENMLAQENEVSSFNFVNDWINGCLYMPLWYRKIKPKKSFFFGLFRRKAKDQWCDADTNLGVKVGFFATFPNRKAIKSKNYSGGSGDSVTYYIPNSSDGCGDECHKGYESLYVGTGIVVNQDTSFQTADGKTAKVWYYKPLEVVNADRYGLQKEYENKGTNLSSITLFATDIVMVGSLNDCDTNGIPKFFNYLSSTTYNMPSDLVQLESIFGDESTRHITISSGADWGNENEYGYDGDSGLFYSIGCAENLTTMGSTINMRRICELGVDNDNMKYVENLERGGESEELDYMDENYYLRPDGYISYDDIVDFDYRSMFATMNGNRLKTIIDTTNGTKKYDFRPLYIDNFDGALYEYMKRNIGGKTNTNYYNNYKLETTSLDYLTFRMSDKPYYYNSSHSIPKYTNSFYFYFGLKEGSTAIEMFNEKYNAKCYTEIVQEDYLNYEAQGNSWCAMKPEGIDISEKERDDALDGWLKMDLTDIAKPYQIILNSSDRFDLTYTIVGDENGKKVDLSNDIIILNRNDDGDTKNLCYVKRETNDGKEVVRKMLDNGNYDVYLTDGEGYNHHYKLSVTQPKLTKDSVVNSFKQTNLSLEKSYGDDWDTCAKVGSVEVKVTSGVPSVLRKDGNTKINGTVCFYNIYDGNNKLSKDKLLFEVTSRTVDEDDNPKFEFNEYDGELCRIDKNGIITKSGTTSPYSVWSGDHYVIKFPRGNEDYQVTISQVCKLNNGTLFKSKNTQKFTVYVSEPIPYKMYINGVDYDIIKNFDTGWRLSNARELQYSEPTGLLPFSGVGNIKDIKGWININDINNEYYSWSEDTDKYGTFDKNKANKYKEWFDLKLSCEPKEDDPFFEIEGNEFSDYHTMWEFGYGKYFDSVSDNHFKSQKVIVNGDTVEPNENGFDLGGDCGYHYLAQGEGKQYENRVKFIETMKDAFWMQEEHKSVAVNVRVQTDETPTSVWVMGNDEMVSAIDGYYYETEGEMTNGRDKWKYKGGESLFNQVYVPNLTSYDSTYYGVKEDKVRLNNYKSTYIENSYCYGQSNISKDSDKNGVNIKPPYIVACVNREGDTKPYGLKKGDSYGSGEYGFEFGDVDGNSGYISKGGNEFFQFMFIDKIFTTDIVYWSYFNNIPFYLPDAIFGDISNKKLGKSLNVGGLLSGLVKNGSTDKPADCSDFTTKKYNNKNISIETFSDGKGGYVDDSAIPTNRCIMFSGDNVIYRNYKHTNGVSKTNQYIEVAKGQKQIELTDKNEKSSTKDIYGSFGLKVAFKPSSLNLWFIKLKFASINVSSRGIDTDSRYYLINANEHPYPINSFNTDDGENFYADFNNDMSPWNDKNPITLFSRNTSEEDIANKAFRSFADGDMIETENGDEARLGFDVFDLNKTNQVYIIAVSNGGARTISALFDLREINYDAGYFKYNDEYYVRFGMKNILQFGHINNYYLAEYSFSIEYDIKNGDDTIRNGSFVYDKEKEYLKSDSDMECIDYEKVEDGTTYGYSYDGLLGTTMYGTITVYGLSFGEPSESISKPDGFDNLPKLPIRPMMDDGENKAYYFMCGGSPIIVSGQGYPFFRFYKESKIDEDEYNRIKSAGNLSIVLKVTDATNITQICKSPDEWKNSLTSWKDTL